MTMLEQFGHLPLTVTWLLSTLFLLLYIFAAKVARKRNVFYNYDIASVAIPVLFLSAYFCYAQWLLHLPGKESQQGGNNAAFWVAIFIFLVSDVTIRALEIFWIACVAVALRVYFLDKVYPHPKKTSIAILIVIVIISCVWLSLPERH